MLFRSQGLVAPAAAVTLLGKSGAVAVLLVRPITSSISQSTKISVTTGRLHGRHERCVRGTYCGLVHVSSNVASNHLRSQLTARPSKYRVRRHSILQAHDRIYGCEGVSHHNRRLCGKSAISRFISTLELTSEGTDMAWSVVNYSSSGRH